MISQTIRFVVSSNIWLQPFKRAAFIGEVTHVESSSNSSCFRWDLKYQLWTSKYSDILIWGRNGKPGYELGWQESELLNEHFVFVLCVCVCV